MPTIVFMDMQIVDLKRHIAGKTSLHHIFTSQTLHPQSIEYLQNIRRLKLSDHTPIEVVFKLKFA